mmetsp:Transcript_4270/g.6250  ORF Transcript_4270/g.6250 Transcript_4270/m.6250 type:complete len:197 (+) Transcript_4270:191-781(+)
MPSKASLLFIALHSSTSILTLNVVDSFQITSTPFSSSCSSRSSSRSSRKIIQELHSSNNDDSTTDEPEEEQLILGSKMSESLQKLGTEAGYLEAARKRNIDAKAKYMEQIRKEEEEAEAIRRAKKETGVSGNFGPGDMTGWSGFKDDGFEDSEENDESGGWGEIKSAEGEGEGGDGPTLFVPGSDDAASGGSGLIL